MISREEFMPLARWGAAIVTVIAVLAVCPPLVSMASNAAVATGAIGTIAGIGFAAASLSRKLDGLWNTVYDAFSEGDAK